MSSRGTNVEIAIVGAGPAGSTAATCLARAGRRVLLIEQHQFPREKVCGGCLSGTGASLLRALLGGRKPPGLPSTRISFIVGPHRLTCPSMGRTWMAPRAELDACLADAARDAGTEIRFGASANLELSGDRWDLSLGGERICADFILLGSGLGGLLRKTGIQGRRIGRPMVAQQWIQPSTASLPRLGEVELHWLRGGYIGLATNRPDQTVVALAACCDGLNGRSVYDRLRELNPSAPIIAGLPSDAPRRFGARGTAGFPWLPERLGDRNLLLIGDAAGYAEPYSGEGIGQAMESAMCAAQALSQPGDYRDHYARLMRGHHRRVFWRARGIRRVLQSEMIHFLAGRLPFLPRRLLSRLVSHVHVSSSTRACGLKLPLCT